MYAVKHQRTGSFYSHTQKGDARWVRTKVPTWNRDFADLIAKQLNTLGHPVIVVDESAIKVKDKR